MAGVDNLKPWKPGESGNPAGKPKGALSWSTIVKDVLEDEDLFEQVKENAPRYIQNLKLKGKNAATAITVAMIYASLQGDKGAAEWLRKTGFGDKLDITSDGEKIQQPVILSDIKPRGDDDTAG